MLANSRDIIKRLERDGWTLKRINGSHHVFTKPGFRNNIVPHPKRTLGPGIILDIYRVAGWPKD
jgi:predicted RNA binding protein YcfA (HicA-like mRNA interferase family)